MLLENPGPNAQLALDTIRQKPTHGVASWLIHPMEHSVIERIAGAEPGQYVRDPHKIYHDMQLALGTCLIDQWIPDNPLSMGAHGYEAGRERTATTGAEQIVRDGRVIDSPEAVVAHLDKIVFPGLKQAAADFDEDARVAEIVAREKAIQEEIGPNILKSGYGFISFPGLAYGAYGYANFFMAYALYPDVMETCFSLQADVCVLRNRAAARAFDEGGLPPLYRLDHDMADSRGTLVNIESLDNIWLPHFARALEPMLKTDVRMIWHCDGNLSQMVPRLLDVGIAGFQGFQYEDNMDYEKICRMTTRDGRDLIIIGGVSVTRTLPMGAPDDVRAQIKFLVENGPPTGLFLGGSSSMTPGVPWDNVQALIDGLKYYRTHPRG